MELLEPLAISRRFVEYFRCPERYGSFAAETPLSEAGYFYFNNRILFGHRCTADDLPDASAANLQPEFSPCNDSVPLPFNVDEVIDNLRLERYVSSAKQGHPARSMVGRAYYFVRPLLPVKVRRQLQKARLSGWRDLKFPQWPVDRTVDHTMNDLLLISLRAHGVDRVPFIWFWPEGSAAAAVVTHDVETGLGRDSGTTIMDIDDSFGIKASFQVVPEKRYEVTQSYIDSIWKRGFEVAVHDLNHDGHLFRDRKEFLRRAEKINIYKREFRAEGFRAAVLYRNQEWYDALEFSYDSSVPNVASLDPQRGGCCTVMPYSVSQLIELPVTVTQDYSLFHILNDYSLTLWKQQIELILESHGLINVIIHPDYILSSRERTIFEGLLSHLANLREERGVWIALPKDVACWWRQRSRMRIVEDRDGLRIEGEGKERARIAYASERDGRLVVEVCPADTSCLVKN